MLSVLALESHNSEKLTSNLITISSKTKSQTSSASFLRKLRDSCDGGLGFAGKCLTDSSVVKALKLPDTASSVLSNSVLPWLTKVTGAMLPQFCIGDFSQSEIDKEKLGNARQSFGCSSVPLKAGGEYGVIGIAVDNIPCGKPVTVAACLTFDKCGTAALSINGGAIACVATMTTGVGAVLSAVAGVLKTATLGVSLDRKFELDYKLVYPAADHTSVEEKSVTTYGHLYFGVQLELELSDLSEKLEFLDKFFALSGKVQMMVDLGNIGSTASSLWKQITSSQKSSAKNLLKTIASEGGELTIQYSGNLAIKLRELTNNFLSDIEIDLGSMAFLVTLKGGSTGLPMGIYMYFESNLAQGLLTAIQDLSEQLGGILDHLGFKLPSLKELDISAGIFFNTEAMGFKFEFLGLDVQCIYMFSAKKGSCKFDDKIFTAIINAGKWVIKEAKKLFDETGKEIAEIDQTIKDFSIKTFNEVKQGVKIFAKDVAVAEKDVGKALTTAGKDVGKAVTTAGKDVGKALTTAGKDVGKGIKSIAKKLHL